MRVSFLAEEALANPKVLHFVGSDAKIVEARYQFGLIEALVGGAEDGELSRLEMRATVLQPYVEGWQSICLPMLSAGRYNQMYLNWRVTPVEED